MNLLRSLLPLAAVALAARAWAQAPVYGVLESYFIANRTTPGAIHRLSWGEFNWRALPNVKLTGSFTQMPDNWTLDEVCAAVDYKSSMLRVGRMRTAFGFNNWSEVFYNGFNHVPLVRMSPLTDGMRLTRDDSGLEFTTYLGGLQIQVAAVDTSLGDGQITPDNVDTGTVRLQGESGRFVLGLDAMKRLRHEPGVYGFDLRYTAPYVTSRVEYFNGDGSPSSQGYYADVQYRLPGHPRTSIVGMTEMFDKDKTGKPTFLHTVGVRQFFTRHLAVNLNYGWGSRLDNLPAIRMQGLDNWTLRAMFQIQF
ncbi:hypothetical protein EON82_03855 [bacterium]|nr:MAG: hypothetical protein EON82_03855 [bacterium]